MIRLLFVFVFILTWSTSTFGQFQVSENRRFITRDGKPFFWLGDTAWELFHRLSKEDATYYFKKRSEQGFTVIQAVALAELDGLQTPNANGDLPLIDLDPTKPNEKYFAHVDSLINIAGKFGLTIALLPTWGDKVDKSTWGKGPDIFNVKNANTFGKWMGQRFEKKTNVIWIMGGDRNPKNAQQVEIWNALAEGVTAGAGGPNKVLMSFHPQPNALGSAEWFHQSEWLDFNMFQNGHCRDQEHYLKISTLYNKAPFKPIIDGEPLYEDHPVCFNAKDLGTSSAYDIRKYAYLDLFAGAFGHTYGCHDVWQMYDSTRVGINGPHFPWKIALDLPGANQMKFARELMESKSMFDRIPDQSILIESDETPGERIQATRGKDYVFVYSCVGKRFRLKMGQIPGEKSAFFWVNPRTGEKSTKNNINNTGIQTFTPPTKGYGLDWVMVLESLPDPKPEVKPEPAAIEVKPSPEVKAIPEAKPSSGLNPNVAPTTPSAGPEVKVEPKPQATATTPAQASPAPAPTSTPAGTIETKPLPKSTLQANPATTPTVVPEVKVELKPQASGTTPLQASPTATPPPAGMIETKPSSTSTLQTNPGPTPTASTANTATGSNSPTAVNAAQPKN